MECKKIQQLGDSNAQREMNEMPSIGVLDFNWNSLLTIEGKFHTFVKLIVAVYCRTLFDFVMLLSISLIGQILVKYYLL